KRNSWNNSNKTTASLRVGRGRGGVGVCVCVCVCVYVYGVCVKQVKSNRERDRDQKRLLETCMCGIMIISLCVPLVCMRGFVLLGSVCVYIWQCSFCVLLF